MGEFEGYLAGLRERRCRSREEDAAAAAHARRIAERLAALLRQRYGARRVVLAGSLSRGTFRVGSDIDLAVEGISPEWFFRAGADLDVAAEGFAVDLVPIETAAPAYRDELLRTGVVLIDAD